MVDAARVAAIRASLGADGHRPGGDRRRRAHRPDARPRAPRRRRPRPPAGDPVERPADRRRVRRDPAPRSGPERLIEITGNDALTGFTAPKLVWVRDHEPDAWARVAHVLLPKDYVRLRLTGRARARQGRRRGHDAVRPRGARLVDEVLDALGIDRGVAAADLRGSGGDRRPSRAEAAAATGLRAGHARRRRRRRPGGERRRRRGGGRRARWRSRWGRRASCSPRPTAPLFEPGGPRPRLLPRGPGPLAPHVRDAVRGRQPALVPRRARARRRRSSELVAAPAAPRCPPGATGCCSCPTCPGERSPHPDPLARGAFVGLTLAHDRRHLTRAVLEGVAFGLRDGLDLMVAAGMPAPAQIRASGGGTASPLWRQILADVLDAEIATVSHDRGRRLRGGAPGRGRRGLVPVRRGGGRRARDRRPRRRRPAAGRRALRGRCTPGTGSCTRRSRRSFQRRPERDARSAGAPSGA